MKILIAHREGLVLAGVRHALAGDGGFELVGEVHECAGLAALTSELRPEVVLLDIHIPGVGGLACLKELKRHDPELDVVMCSVSSDRLLMEEAFAAGACGYILEQRIQAADLAAAIRQAVASSSSLAAHPLAATGARRPTQGLLTEREQDVLAAVARGLGNAAIAAELSVTVPTVKFHLTKIFRKLDVKNRTEAARWALQHHADVQ